MTESTISTGSIAFIGFGEAARAFLDGWRTEPGFTARVCAYDIKTDSPDPHVRAAKRADYAAANVIGASTAPEAVAGAEAVFSVVTADQAHEAALAALPGLAKGALFLRLQFLRAADQGADREGGRRGGRALCRRRGDGAGPSAPPPHAAPDQRPACRSRGAGARRARHVGADPRRPGRRRLGGQDDPLDHDEGARGAGLRMRAGRAEGGRHRDGARFARRHLSRLRLAEALGLHAGAGDDAWRPPRRGNARGRADRRSARPQRRDVARLGRLAADDRRTRLARRPKRRRPTIGFWPTGFSPRSIRSRAKAERLPRSIFRFARWSG